LGRGPGNGLQFRQTREHGVKIMRPKKNILIVDDNEADLSVTKFLLEMHAYRVFATVDPAEAVTLFSAHTIDLVLTDFLMPDLDGLQLVARLKEIASYVPMIVLGDPLKLSGTLHQADAILNKSTCSPTELLERIRLMAARKRGPRKGTTHTEKP
jgi:two-component system, OmpR family, response regulator CpxR